MRWCAAICLVLVLCCVTIGSTAGDSSGGDSDWVSWPLVREPVLLPPEVPPPTDEPLRPLPKQLPPPPVKPPTPTVVKPPALPPPPTPRFDPNAPAGLTLVYPLAPGYVQEGGQTLVWNTGGPIVTVKLTYRGERCKLGGRSRGTFSGTIGKLANKGTTVWRVPWMDASDCTVRLVGYGADGKELAAAEQKFVFRPRVLQNKPETCIVVSKARQRLYFLREGLVRRMHIISTAAGGYNTPYMTPGSYGSRGAMGRVFSKSYAPVSSLYHVVMYYWLGITSSGSHGIHATSPPFYGRLGGPASHGCIRQHRADAKVLWEMVSVGTPVYVQ